MQLHRTRHRIPATATPLGEVAAMRVQEVAEPNRQGQLVNFTLYAAAASAILVAVTEHGARSRFLLGAAFIAAVGLMALYDAMRPAVLRWWRVTLVALDGGTETVVLDSAGAVGRLQAAVEAARKDRATARPA